ncbi:hypothetical protein QTP81_08425 [Alteromonas sp. ASW11-36]|uniref:STAS/SEC14 domain-containing protein n=1 Tax=Alteromonas arenosi TaxID=3055817 RepID=A0ABT7SWR2_9ALTE|nr:hypothetical protein [Alteromonas sp. ASW11-36]MDM7860619.1 hypothetical protein [Alteromonas sp. ASW11-36]
MVERNLKPHGNVVLTWQNNVLHNHVHGPFNVEGVTLSFEQLRNSTNEQNVSQWARIDVLDPDTLGAMEVMHVIGNSYKWSIENGCVGIASICSTVLQREMLAQFKQQTGLNLEAFDSVEAAQRWCNQQLNIAANN